ncbi:hypothetical protein EIP91_005103 [Steccherinum ochraceum]|uniref:BTB domain-containing protein n=1 Tax=Steccherinum ochraceum TaxID=92696 RepID=A0A4R0RIS9_9APHY|nr:hypothetical protein EIP91_005103 [Steccherinum ochraceum]
MAEDRAAKRPRVDSTSAEDDAQASEYTRGDVWFEDGNAVLVAERTAFRIHRGPVTTETFEGCPVVHVTDRKGDIAHLLSVLYSGEKYLNPKLGIRYEVVSAMIELGTKYQMDAILNTGVALLRGSFPTSLSAYEEDPSYWYSRHRPISRRDIISVVNLARKFDLHDVLPMALLLCSRLLNHSLIKGADSESLSQEDIIRCLNGREELHRRYVQRLAFVTSPRAPVECTSIGECREALSEWGAAWLPSAIGESRPDALSQFHWLASISLCEGCIEVYSDADQVQRNKMWSKLAEIFQVEDVVKEWPPKNPKL